MAPSFWKAQKTPTPRTVCKTLYLGDDRGSFLAFWQMKPKLQATASVRDAPKLTGLERRGCDPHHRVREHRIFRAHVLKPLGALAVRRLSKADRVIQTAMLMLGQPCSSRCDLAP